MKFSLFFLVLVLLLGNIDLNSQDFYYGADQSYVNEMEDCGVVYKENGETEDVYKIFAGQGSNLVRLRLWHTPSWYDGLNSGVRYSDLADVKKSIARAKESNMSVLLDFHLSDEWADPSKQIIPEAWLGVVDDLPSLTDSLYNYIYRTLNRLAEDDLLPEMVQIGNETNKGILQTKEENSTWVLDWPRNAILFNAGIKAVRDFEIASSSDIEIVLHFAGPEDAIWLSEQFIINGITDFDIIGISYYWAWHQPTSIARTGDIIEGLKSAYGKDVMIVETGYIWTTLSNDSANNIISEIDDSYGPASPASQKKWLQDLRDELLESEALGMIYWEPSWQSSSCFTLWGQGSHQEHATFFDFDNNLMIPGGIEWMNSGIVSVSNPKNPLEISFMQQDDQLQVKILNRDYGHPLTFEILDTLGRTMNKGSLSTGLNVLTLDNLLAGTYFLQILSKKSIEKVHKFIVN